MKSLLPNLALLALLASIAAGASHPRSHSANAGPATSSGWKDNSARRRGETTTATFDDARWNSPAVAQRWWRQSVMARDGVASLSGNAVRSVQLDAVVARAQSSPR